MLTEEFNSEEFGHVLVHYHGDFSGEVLVQQAARGGRHWRIPGEVFAGALLSMLKIPALAIIGVSRFGGLTTRHTVPSAEVMVPPTKCVTCALPRWGWSLRLHTFVCLGCMFPPRLPGAIDRTGGG